MKSKKAAVLLATGLSGLLLLAACSGATTQVTGSWMNEEYRGRPLTKMLVLGVSGNETVRRIFEQVFAEEIQSAGPRAVPGYELLPEGSSLDRKKVLERVQGEGFDAVVVTKLLQRQERMQRYTDIHRDAFPSYHHPYYDRYGRPYWYDRPHYHPDWYTDYATSYERLHATEYTVNYEIYTLEINAYDARRGEPIWSAVTETTFIEGNRENLVESFTERVVDRMIEDGLL